MGGSFGLFSRESMLLVNNVLLLVATGAVLLGTLYPLLIDALNLGKLSVGPPYFNAVFAPLMVPLLFLMVVGPMVRWKHASPRDLAKRLGGLFAVALALGLGLSFLPGPWSPGVALGLVLVVWIVVGTAVQIWERMKTGTPPRSFWGMHLAHLGMAATLLGVVMVKGYETERDVRMAPGDTVQAGAYVLHFKSVSEVLGPNYKAARGEMDLMQNGQLVKVMRPEKRQYFSSAMPMSEAAIDPGLTRDIYVSLGDQLEGNDGAWSVRVYYKPFVDWIWIGTIMMALGGLLAASDRRYRVKTKKPAAAMEGAAS
jgi:cytochrome c-type biogenesis protein CcmF